MFDTLLGVPSLEPEKDGDGRTTAEIEQLVWEKGWLSTEGRLKKFIKGWEQDVKESEKKRVELREKIRKGMGVI